jgi:hypothetical protein
MIAVFVVIVVFCCCEMLVLPTKIDSTLSFTLKWAFCFHVRKWFSTEHVVVVLTVNLTMTQSTVHWLKLRFS